MCMRVCASLCAHRYMLSICLNILVRLYYMLIDLCWSLLARLLVYMFMSSFWCLDAFKLIHYVNRPMF